MRILITIFLLLATPLWAEISFPKLTQLNSKLGTVTVRYSGGVQQVYVNGQVIAGAESGMVHLHGLYNHAQDGSQSLLLSLRHRGNGCFDDWMVLRITTNKITPSARFGNCSDRAIALRIDGLGLELDMPDRSISSKHTTYRFSGAGFTATAQMQQDSVVPSAGSGATVTRWVGRHPSEIFADASERQRFRKIMDDAFLDELVNAVSVANSVTQEGGYIYGTGCWPHACNVHAGAYAIRISDGAVFAAIWVKGQQSRIAGGALNDLPYRLRNFVLTGQR